MCHPPIRDVFPGEDGLDSRQRLSLTLVNLFDECMGIRASPAPFRGGDSEILDRQGMGRPCDDFRSIPPLHWFPYVSVIIAHAHSPSLDRHDSPDHLVVAYASAEIAGKSLLISSSVGCGFSFRNALAVMIIPGVQ